MPSREETGARREDSDIHRDVEGGHGGRHHPNEESETVRESEGELPLDYQVHTHHKQAAYVHINAHTTPSKLVSSPQHRYISALPCRTTCSPDGQSCAPVIIR